MQANESNIDTAGVASPANIFRRRIGLFVLLTVWALTWALAHAYEGLRHDGVLYTLQALGHLRPQSLSHDVFLEFGSQDRFTVFSPIYATVMAWLDTEPAAALLTFISQLAFLSSAWVLGRRTLTSSTAVLLGVTVVLAIPGTFGSNRIFHYLETIITPRMMAEALVLCGLALVLSARGAVGLLLCALAALLHPVMAATGFVACFFLQVGIPRPRLTALAGSIALVALLLVAHLCAIGPFSRFDPEWLTMVRLRSPNLFVTTWSFDDWQCALVVLVTLAIALGTLAPGRARTLALAAFLTGLSGLALNLIAVDTLQMVHFTQLQPWRWMWLATVVAALLLPELVLAGWHKGSSGRAPIFLLLSAWLLSGDPLGLYVAAGALGCMIMVARLPEKFARLIFFGTCGVLLIAVLARLAWNSIFLDAYYYDPSLPGWLRKLGSFLHDGSVPVAIAVIALRLSSRPRRTAGLVTLAVLSAAACACVAPYTWRQWTIQQFPPSMVRQFGPWRELIPPGDTVFWPESPLEASLLLERPDYLSRAQTTGLVFSRPAAMELRRRAFAMATVTAPLGFLQFNGNGIGLGPSPSQLARACQTREFQFLVTGAHLDWAPVAEVPRAVWHSSGGLRLYRCSDRAAGDGA